MKTIYCPLRQIHVAAQPEELVRQRIIDRMINQLGFPKSGLAVEKALSQLPHLQQSGLDLPSRRVDIISYATGIHPEFSIYPLLVVECKAIEMSEKVLQQVAGYNHFIGAPFVCIANEDQLFTGWHEGSSGKYRFVDFLPPYQELVRYVLKKL